MPPHPLARYSLAFRRNRGCRRRVFLRAGVAPASLIDDGAVDAEPLRRGRCRPSYDLLGEPYLQGSTVLLVRAGPLIPQPARRVSCSHRESFGSLLKALGQDRRRPIRGDTVAVYTSPATRFRTRRKQPTNRNCFAAATLRPVLLWHLGAQSGSASIRSAGSRSPETSVSRSWAERGRRPTLRGRSPRPCRCPLANVTALRPRRRR